MALANVKLTRTLRRVLFPDGLPIEAVAPIAGSRFTDSPNGELVFDLLLVIYGAYIIFFEPPHKSVVVTGLTHLTIVGTAQPMYPTPAYYNSDSLSTVESYGY